ncbi:hypothetical protein H6P81_005284 [Aristolochia fimbriata]|uniref:DUF7610 domain-containing protein n=1 Tax=Aristolochia fimbriata TaxID=158543 RepID=A0AAV7EW84_ARIFI|nr:hypothetical protein H6P81_005284 [Aristolochia fimbriata]
MAKRLRKKLEELETDLSKLVEQPMDATLPFLFQEIERRLKFLKNLLSSEIETHHENPHHLRDLALRMALLERAFTEWTEITTVTPRRQDHFDAQISVPDSPPDIDDVDSHSMCSCTKPSPFQSEEGEEVTAVGDGEGECREKKKKKNKKKKKKKKVLLGKKGLAMAIVTAILAVWLATESFSAVISGHYEENEFLAPT